MSRTYRYKNLKPPYWVTSKRKYWDEGWIPLKGKELKAAIAKFYAGYEIYYGYYSSCPSWFIKDTFHRPARAEWRLYKKKIYSSVDYDDLPVFKFIGNKPKEYYW